RTTTAAEGSQGAQAAAAAGADAGAARAGGEPLYRVGAARRVRWHPRSHLQRPGPAEAARAQGHPGAAPADGAAELVGAARLPRDAQRARSRPRRLSAAAARAADRRAQAYRRGAWPGAARRLQGDSPDSQPDGPAPVQPTRAASRIRPGERRP